jgi:cytochrome c oxidase cbb3-type subunit 3
MRAGTGWVAALTLGVALTVTVRATGEAQQQPAQPAQPPVIEGHGGPTPPGTPAPQTPRPGGAGAQQPPRPGRFPAQQRGAFDPAVVERGRGVYASTCAPCHGLDARGGQLGGPNLLRSQLVLNDKNGELISPVVKNGRPGNGGPAMPPMALPDADIAAAATFLHSLQAKIGGQGDPPPGEEVPLNILVGNAKAGESYFAAKCATCHSASGDLKGLATRVAEPKALQNLWVSGGRAAARGVTQATVTLPSGEKVTGPLVRYDDFLITVTTAEGPRTFRRTGDVPKVEIVDPLEGHRTLLGVLTDADMHNVTAYLVTLK